MPRFTAGQRPWLAARPDGCPPLARRPPSLLRGQGRCARSGRLPHGPLARPHPWEEPELYRSQSPLTYATRIRTPLLTQHAEQDLRCPVTQAEELFSVLRSLRRPVRLMRTPGESHELTRSGSPYRRIENLERIRDWFAHFLVAGARTLPPTS